MKNITKESAAPLLAKPFMKKKQLYRSSLIWFRKQLLKNSLLRKKRFQGLSKMLSKKLITYSLIIGVFLFLSQAKNPPSHPQEESQKKENEKKHLLKKPLEDDSAEGHYNKGNAFYAAKAYEAALRQYKAAVKADEEFSKAYYKIAAIYALQENKRESLYWLEEGYIHGLTPLPISWDYDFKKYWKDRDFKKLRKRAKKYLPEKKCSCCGQIIKYKKYIKIYDKRQKKRAARRRKSKGKK
jgi:tetratricopeptide (TPR) repeat protein